jgi:hypothetical protein
MEISFRIGAAQYSALEIFVFDVVFEDEEELAFEGRLEAGRLIVEGGLERAYRAITEAANGCDNDAEGLGQPGLSTEEKAQARRDRDALSSLAMRILKAK